MSTETSHNPRFYDLTSASWTLARPCAGVEKWNKSVTQLQKVYIYLCVGVSKPLLRCWKFDTRPTEQFVLILFDFFSFLSSARDAEMCVSMERALGLFQKKLYTVRAQHPTIYRGWINRLEWNSIPPFSHSLSPKTLLPFSLFWRKRGKISAEIFQKGKRRKNTLGKKKVWRWDFYYWATHTKERGGVSNNS